MARRTHYRNGDEITLHCGCDSCSPNMINGVLCHEVGCPSAWKDEPKACGECGEPFFTKWGDPICEGCLEEANRPQLDDQDELEGESDDDDEFDDDLEDDD